jgi:hypothetical protein
MKDEAPRSKLRGIKAELRHSQPGFAVKSFAVVRPAIHPCSKLQGILAKANKNIFNFKVLRLYKNNIEPQILMKSKKNPSHAIEGKSKR